MIHFWNGKTTHTPCGLPATELESEWVDEREADAWNDMLDATNCQECHLYFKEPRRPREKLSVTIEIDPSGSWSANRGMIAPDDYPRAIQAIENLLLNMKEEGGVFFAKRAISKAVQDSRCGACGSPSWMPHAHGCKR